MWKVDVIWLALPLATVGVALGIRFPFSVLFLALAASSALSWPLGEAVSMGTAMTAMVSAIALQAGYFIGLVVRAYRNANGRGAAYSPSHRGGTRSAPKHRDAEGSSTHARENAHDA